MKKRSMWEYPKEKSEIEKAIRNVVLDKKKDTDYILSRIGYCLYTGEKAPEHLPKIKEAIDIIKNQKIPISIAKQIFEYVALTLTISFNAENISE